jgi:hypothetical protein
MIDVRNVNANRAKPVTNLIGKSIAGSRPTKLVYENS